jgi:Co/Zn/Cd efflux system component
MPHLGDIAQSVVLLVIGILILLTFYYLADFILSNVLIILPIAVIAIGFGFWRWGSVRR